MTTYPNVTRASFLLLCLFISSISSRGADNENRWSSQLCGQLSYNGTTGTFHSPYYPENYNRDNLDCRYLIDVSEVGSSRILLAFADFATESSADYVEVYEGSDIETSPRIGIFSGNYTIPGRILSNSSTMIVRFSTDYVDSNYRGFSATWTAV